MAKTKIGRSNRVHPPFFLSENWYKYCKKLPDLSYIMSFYYPWLHSIIIHSVSFHSIQFIQFLITFNFRFNLLNYLQYSRWVTHFAVSFLAHSWRPPTTHSLLYHVTDHFSSVRRLTVAKRSEKSEVWKNIQASKELTCVAAREVGRKFKPMTSDKFYQKDMVLSLVLPWRFHWLRQRQLQVILLQWKWKCRDVSFSIPTRRLASLAFSSTWRPVMSIHLNTKSQTHNWPGIKRFLKHLPVESNEAKRGRRIH